MRRLLVTFAALALVVGLAPQHSSPARHLSGLDAVTVATSTSSGGAPYGFSTVLSGKPVRWNPCAIIYWQFRGPGAPQGALPVVRAAVARIALATGTTWVFKGTVASTPASSWLPDDPSARRVLIGWTDARHSDLLRNQPGSVLGVTRTTWFGVDHGSTTVAAIRGAVVALDMTDHLPLTGPSSWYAVTLHELGHAMGLAHAGSSRELMYPVLQPGLTRLQPGDLAGLARVGRSQGCVNL